MKFLFILLILTFAYSQCKYKLPPIDTKGLTTKFQAKIKTTNYDFYELIVHPCELDSSRGSKYALKFNEKGETGNIYFYEVMCAYLQKRCFFSFLENDEVSVNLSINDITNPTIALKVNVAVHDIIASLLLFLISFLLIFGCIFTFRVLFEYVGRALTRRENRSFY